MEGSILNAREDPLSCQLIPAALCDNRSPLLQGNHLWQNVVFHLRLLSGRHCLHQAGSGSSHRHNVLPGALRVSVFAGSQTHLRKAGGIHNDTVTSSTASLFPVLLMGYTSTVTQQWLVLSDLCGEGWSVDDFFLCLKLLGLAE